MEKIIPFSNGTEFMIWMDQNCDTCRSTGCYAKYAICFGTISGTITLKQAERIGYNGLRLNQECLMYTTIRISPKKILKQELTLNLF